MSHFKQDVICALATPSGRGGIAIVRLSGPDLVSYADALIGGLPLPRQVSFRHFTAADGQVIDTGLAIYFPAPASFTGEEVLELHSHGSPLVIDMLLECLLALGARLARPGEFSERAFLNGRMDLTQAEAVADLIDAGSRTAARLAARTLQGVFRKHIEAFIERLIHVRVHVEAAIDFSDEDIDFLANERIMDELDRLQADIEQIQASAAQGVLLRDGIQLVIAGRPNAGKSSLLNALSGRERAIVTEIPGTTRDVLREQIDIDGLPLHLVDTAGLRESECLIEQEGVRRAQAEMEGADLILWVYDATQDLQQDAAEIARLPQHTPITLIRNKIDSISESPREKIIEGSTHIGLSAKQGDGLELLRAHLKSHVGYQNTAGGEFIARRRHLDAIQQAHAYLTEAVAILTETRASELLAEELRLAQQALESITGRYLPDDLLGEIFARFCIGK